MGKGPFDFSRVCNDIQHRGTNFIWIARLFSPDEAIRMDIGDYPFG